MRNSYTSKSALAPNIKSGIISNEKSKVTIEIKELPLLPMETIALDRKLKKINIKKLVETIKIILEHPIRPFTPLLIDPSSRVDVFFEYSADYSGIFIDSKKLVIDTLIKKTWTLVDALEYLRSNLVLALKHGKTLVICMQDAATDFQSKFTHENHFPSAIVLSKGGRDMLLEANYKKVIRESDLTNGNFICDKNFKVVITSKFELEDYEEFLKKSIPLEETIPIFIEPAVIADHDSYKM